jgi:hypothetical protein
VTDPNAVRKELFELETRLIQPEVRRSREAVAQLLADGFVEFGSSGSVHSKEQILDGLKSEVPRNFSLADFRVCELAEGLFLATYRTMAQSPAATLIQSRRSSIWRNVEGRWQMLFHQGTPLPHG